MHHYLFSTTTAPILDVGAGTGRNTLPLAKLGYPVDVLEVTPEFAEQIKAAAVTEELVVNITVGDILEPLAQMRTSYYKLAVLSEVVPHFRSSAQVQLLLAKMCSVLRPSGLLLFSTFLTINAYEPDQLTRQISQVAWSYLLTRLELMEAVAQLPLDLLSDESVLDYERSLLPSEAWPPTGWFVSWASGHDLFGYGEKLPPLELRWLLFKRQ